MQGNTSIDLLDHYNIYDLLWSEDLEENDTALEQQMDEEEEKYFDYLRSCYRGD